MIEAKCPDCANTVTGEFGMSPCPNCGALVFIGAEKTNVSDDFEEMEIGGGSIVTNNTNNDWHLEEFNMPGDENADLDSPELEGAQVVRSEVTSEFSEVTSGNWQEDMEVSKTWQDESNKNEEGIEEIESSIHQVLDDITHTQDTIGTMANNQEQEVIEEYSEGFETYNVNEQEQLEKKASSDLSEITDYANSPVSQAKHGFLMYTLIIEGIDTSALRMELRENLTNKKLLLDVEALMSGIKNGRLEIKKLNPVKASFLVNMLRTLNLKLSWEQYAITDI